jgi:hypothetical protein
MGGVSLGLHHQVLPFLSSSDLLQGLKYGEINPRRPFVRIHGKCENHAGS